eukprot:m.333387 g.333387  ORF g.333387 m.333387 type:complete len:66 (-) comp17135_c0_seq1:698-895(-)
MDTETETGETETGTTGIGGAEMTETGEAETEIETENETAGFFLCVPDVYGILIGIKIYKILGTVD